MYDLKKIWNERKQILEGLSNSVFVKQEVENIAELRNQVCTLCECYDTEGSGCEIPFTQPCCNKNKGGCGCSLHIKQRSLSSSCPNGYWPAILSQEEENKLDV